MKTALINNFYESNYGLLKVFHPLRRITLEITNQCNLQCKHCYMSASRICFPSVLKFEEIKNFADELKNKFGGKVPISITGGEPFLREDIYKIMEYLKKLGFQISISTNSLLINDRDVHKLKNFIDAISISLDGEEDDHNFLRNANVFDRTIKKINLIKESGIPLTIKTVIFRRNVKRLFEIYNNLIKNINPFQWHLIPILKCGRAVNNVNLCISNDDYEIVYEQIEKIVSDQYEKGNKINIVFDEGNLMIKNGKFNLNPRRCQAGITMMSILFNGDVVSCINQDRQKIAIQGNIKYNDLDELWRDGFKENRSKAYNKCLIHEK